MNIDSAFPSKYLKAADLPDDGTPAPYTIKTVRMEEVGRDKDEKPVIYFSNEEKGFVCNVTNKNTIKKVLGTGDTDEWEGKTILLYSTEVPFGDEMVESIRVKLRAGKATGEASKRPPVVQNQTADDYVDDSSEVPF